MHNRKNKIISRESTSAPEQVHGVKGGKKEDDPDEELAFVGREIAYAAMDANSTVRATVTTEVMALARYQFQMSPPVKIVT